MSVYLSIYGFFAALSLPNARKNSLLYLTLTLVFFSWFAGLRFFVGCDYNGYGVRFLGVEGFTISELLSKQEFSFHLLTYFSSVVFGEYNAFVLLTSVIIISLFLWFAKNFEEFRFIFALFIPVLIYKLGMSGLRQALAVGFVCLAYISFLNVKRAAGGIYILVASTFHTSAIIFLPLAFMAGREFNLAKVALSILIASLPVAIFLSDRIGIYQDRYIEQIYGSQDSSGAWIRFTLNFLPVPFFLIKRKLFENKYPDQYNLLMLGALMILTSALLGLISSVALHRISYYLMPLSILLAVCTLDLFKNRLHGKMVWLGVYFLYISTWFIISRHADVCYLPYQNVTFFSTYTPDWFQGFQ